MKYSRTALGLLNAQYRSVLRKCFLINMGLFALGAIATATPANATEYTTQQVLTSDTEYTASDSFNGSTSATGMYGGAIENTGHNLTINGSSFTGNYLNTGGASDARGGAIYQAGGELVINNASFVDNYTMRDLGGRAGAINTANATTTISNSEFQNNSTRTSTGENWVYGGMGAAIYQGGGTLTLNNNTFGGDTTAEGNKGAEGVIVSNGGEMIVNSNTFKNNNASGGIFNLQNDTTNVTFTGKNTFENNTGSPIYNWIVKDTTTFAGNSETVFKSNTANTKDQYGGANNGGAIWNVQKIAFEEGSTVEFTGNHADGKGGAVYNYTDSTIDFDGEATFSENTASNGGAIFNKGTMTLADGATFLNNDLTGNGDGADIYNNGGSITIGDNLTVTHEGEMTADCNIYSDNGGYLKIGDNATFNGGGDAIVTSGPVDSRAKLIIGDGSKFSNFDDAAIIAWSNTDATIGKNATFDNTGLAIQNSRNSSTTFDDGFVVKNAGNTSWGAILNRANDGGDGTTTLEFLGTATIKDNTNVGLYNRLGAITTFDGKTTFSGNTASGNGAAIRNVDGTSTYNSTVTFNDEATFTGNAAQGTGGAIYNATNGVVNFNDNATFSGNTDVNGSNDIYNAGTINFNGGADLAGGIDGSAGTVNVNGEGIQVAKALKNQTVNVAGGSELHLNAADVTDSTINLGSDAVLNTINNAVDDYSSITLTNNSNIKVDANLASATMDKFGSTYGQLDLNIVEANMIGSSDEEVTMQLVNDGTKVNTSSVIYEWDDEAQKHTKTGIVGSGDFDGKVKVSNGATVSNLEVAARDTSSAVKESVVYEMGESENFGTETVENATFIVEGNNQSVNVSGKFGVDNKSVVTINDATFNGEGSIDSKGKLRINDSYININVNLTDHAILESDPTEYSAKVSVDSTSTATFDEDTFTSTAELANAGTANLSNVTFEDGSKITGNGGTGALNFTNGTTTLGATVADNTLNIQNGASVVLTESGDIDGLALANDANGGTIDLRNNKIDTLGSTALSSTLNVLMDIDLNADTSDNLGTISGTGGLNLTALELLKLGSDTENIQIATAGTNVTLSSNAENTLKTYYSNVSYDSGTGILTLSGKNASASADLVGTWGTGNYIKAYSATDSANTSVGANLTILDEQVKTNEDAISAAETAIGGINDDITVATAGNYIAAGTEVANNLTALDAAVSGKQDALTAGNGIDITSNTISVKNASLANFDASKVTDSTEVAALLANPATASDDNVLTEKAVVTGIGALFDEKQTWVDNTLGIVSAHSDAVKEQYASTNYLKDATTLTGADKALDTQIKANADAIASKTLTVDTTTGIATIKDGTTTANVYTKEAAEAIFNEKQTWVDNTLGIVSAHADAVKEQYASTNYLTTATTLTGADKLLDAAIATKQDALTAGSGIDITSNVISVKGATLANFDAATVTDSTEVAALLADPTTASDANVLTEKAVVTGIKALFDEKQTWVDNTLGIVSAHADAVKEQYASTNYLKDATTLTGADKLLDAQIKANADQNTTQDTALANLYTAVNGGTYNPADGSVTGAATLSGFTATNLTAAANELLTDITVTADGNYITAGADVKGNLSALDGQVKDNADNIASTMALVGTTSAPKTGHGILAGKTITGTAGTDNLNMVDAIDFVAANAAGLNVDNVYSGKNTFGTTSGSQVIIDNGGNLTVNHDLTIGKANAISSTATGKLDMGGNTLLNVQGLTLTDGSGHTATLAATENGINTGNADLDVGTGALKSQTLYVGTTDQFSVDGSGNVSTSGTLDVTGKATVGSLDIGTTGKGFDATGNLTAGTINATGIDTTTANTVKLGGTGFTTAVTGDMTVSGTTTLTDLTVTGDTTLDDLTVNGNTSLKNTTVDGTLEVTGGAIFGDKTDQFVDITDGAITVHDGTGSANITASIANNGNITTKGALEVAGLASLNGGINVNDQFEVSGTDGTVTLTNGTNTASIAMTDVKVATDDPLNPEPVTNVMKVTGTGLFTGDVVSESGFTIAQKNGVDQYEVKFSVNEDGDIDTLGTLSVADDKFTVDGSGNMYAAGDADIDGDLSVGNKFSVTSADGSFSAAGGEFKVDGDGNTKIKGAMAAGKTGTEFKVGLSGNISAASGNFTVDKDGNVTAQGDLGVQGTSWLKNTNVDGALAVTGDTTVGQNFAVAGNSYLHNTSVDGALAVTGTSWLKNTNVDGALAVSGDSTVGQNFAVAGTSYLHNTVVNGDMAVSGTTKTTALTFDGESYVAAMDQGDAAITNGTVDDQAKRTMATNATVAKTIGNLAALENTHGVTSVADVASAIDSLATNVETATGGTFTNNVWKGTVTMAANPDYTYNGATGHANIMAFVNDLASNIGAETAAAKGNIAKNKTVNANLDALDEAIGDRSNLGSANEAINQGTKTSVAAGMRAVGDAIGDMNFAGSHYVAGNNDLSGAVRSLDSNLYRVESDLRDLRRDFRRGMASMSAMSALVPNPRAHGNTSLAIGTGAYDGHTAAAIGGFHYLTDNIMLNAGVAWGNSSDAAYRMGVTFSW